MLVKQSITFHDSDGKMVVKKVHDAAPYIKDVEEMKARGIDGFGENKLVGRIPMWLLNEWIKEANLEWSDTEEVRALIRTKLLSGEFDKLRPWEGTF